MELPDFEDMQKLVRQISHLSVQKSMTEIEIKKLECGVFVRSQNEPNLFQNGKPPSASFVENAYKYTGVNNEIIPLRERLALLSAQLEECKLTFQLMQDKVEVWRSEQANNRISLTV